MDRKRLLKTALGRLLAFTMAFAPLLSSYSVIAFAAGADQEAAAGSAEVTGQGSEDPSTADTAPAEETAPTDPAKGSGDTNADTPRQEDPEEAEPEAETPEEETAPSGDGSENDSAASGTEEDKAKEASDDLKAKEEAASEEAVEKMTADIKAAQDEADTLHVSVDNTSEKPEDVRIYLWKDHDSFTDGTAKDKIVRNAEERIIPKCNNNRKTKIIQDFVFLFAYVPGTEPAFISSSFCGAVII